MANEDAAITDPNITEDNIEPGEQTDAETADAAQGSEQDIATIPNAAIEMPPHMSGVTDEQLNKAKRSRWVLIIAIVLGVVVLAALIYLGYKVVSEQQEAKNNIVAPTASLDKPDNNSDGKADDILTDPVAMAHLATLVGMPADAVADKLGKNYQMIDVEQLKDKKHPELAQLVTYTNSGSDGSAASEAFASTDTLYLTIDKGNTVVEVYDVISMDALGFPDTPFMTLLKDSVALSNVLKNIGITPIELNFTAPQIKDVTQYLGKEGAVDRKIVKQEASYEGKAQGSVVDIWKVTFTYDYGAGVPADGSNLQTTSRTLAVRITG